MKVYYCLLISFCFLATTLNCACSSQPKSNILLAPRQILTTSTDLQTDGLSPSALALAKQLQLTALLAFIQAERQHLNAGEITTSIENLSRRQIYLEARQDACEIIEQTRLEIDFALAEIDAEESLYNELIHAYSATRDRKVAFTNALAFGSNGALWALSESLSIPTFGISKFSIPAGVTGILAGIIPSIASFYALRQVGGNRYTIDEDPNMLAKIFGYPTSRYIDYPQSIWEFLSASPPGDTSGRSRRQQIIDRWVEDKNLPTFTDPGSRQQLSLLAATDNPSKNITIQLLAARRAMLQQLGSEIFKMNRLVLELMLVVRGKKKIAQSADPAI